MRQLLVQLPKQFDNPLELVSYCLDQNSYGPTPRVIGDKSYIACGDEVYSLEEVGQAFLERAVWISEEEADQRIQTEEYRPCSSEDKIEGPSVYLLITLQSSPDNWSESLEGWLHWGNLFTNIYHLWRDNK